jgi:hypothetical protein
MSPLLLLIASALAVSTTRRLGWDLSRFGTGVELKEKTKRSGSVEPGVAGISVLAAAELEEAWEELPKLNCAELKEWLVMIRVLEDRFLSGHGLRFGHSWIFRRIKRAKNGSPGEGSGLLHDYRP